MLETVAICMSELQDQFDKGLITAAEFNARWDEEMEENERLHPGIHAQMQAYLLAEFPGSVVDADEFFGLKDSTKMPPRRTANKGR
jgi:hypothetical protein